MTSSALNDVIVAQQQGTARGITAICSANTFVLEASFTHARANGYPLLIESTCNQVNQFGGYTGQTPEQFMTTLRQLAEKHRFPAARLVVGGDHLGPNPWRDEPAAQAMDKSRDLVAAYVYAGYTKIHLDTSMNCAGDGQQRLTTETIAGRTADLAQVAEACYQSMGQDRPALHYVIGTEVPAPGGVDETEEGAPAVTSTQSVEETIRSTRDAFRKRGLEDAWERVIAVVVQPGVEYGNEALFEYDPAQASALSRFIKEIDGLVFEAHSTDYQTRLLLHEMVRDQFAILKVGPALTFAFREAIFALAAIEEIWRAGSKTSNVRQVVDEVMLANPQYWRSYYPGDAQQQEYARQYSLSDRIRYYWPVPQVQAALQLLLDNLAAAPIPLPLLSQFLPEQYRGVRDGRLPNEPGALIEDKITAVLADYAFACGWR